MVGWRQLHAIRNHTNSTNNSEINMQNKKTEGGIVRRILARRSGFERYRAESERSGFRVVPGLDSVEISGLYGATKNGH